MDLWAWLEKTIPVGEATAVAATLRKKAEEATGDMRSIDHMALCRFYNEEAEKRPILSPLLRHIATRHLRQAIQAAQYYPDPLAVRAGELGKEGDYWEAAKEIEAVIPRQRVWIDAFKDPDGSRQLQLCTYLSAAGATRSLLAQFDQALFWYMEALKEFKQLSVEVRASQFSLEDKILSGVMKSLLGQFRYEDALFFVDLALKEEMFSAYQSEVRHDLRAQKELLPGLVARTRGYQFPEEGLKLWADLMDKVQRCDTPDGAREIQRKIFSTIERHEAAKQVGDLEDEIVDLLRKNYGSPPELPPQASLPAPPPQPDLSAIKDPKWRETFEKVNRANELLRQRAEQHAAEIAETVRRGNEAMASLNQAAIANIHERASAIYRVPRWLRVQWNLRAVARLAVKFLAIEFLIGKVLEKLLESQGKSVLERMHFGVSEAIITAAVAIVLFFLSMPAEKRIDEMSLRSYKQLLQKLVADRVTTYWATYNALLRIFTGAKEEGDKLAGRKRSGPESPPAAGEKAS
jgi:hypothetical protein